MIAGDWQGRMVEGAAELGVGLSEAEAEVLVAFMRELMLWNRRLNLTGIKSEEEMVEKLFVDSLACWLGGWVQEGARVVDVGTGAGFPGVVVAVTGRRRGVAEVVLVEAARKKARFLEQAVKAVGIVGVRVVGERAEILGRMGEYRERFDVGTARAVAPLGVVGEYVLPLVRVGGVFLAMKGRRAAEEMREAGGALRALGGEVEEVRWYRLPWSGQERAIVVVRKVRGTEARYPRRPGVARRRPLGGRGGE